MQLVFCEAGFGWRPQFDNPTFLGWFVVAIYGLGALACARTAVLARASRIPSPRHGLKAGGPGMWRALAAALCFLGINKQLNLQTLLIVCGRHLVAMGGWTDLRRSVQLGFSLLFGLGLGLLLVWLAASQREFFRSHPWTLWGVLILGLFVVLRAATINHVDAYLGVNLNDKQWAWILEIGGSALIGIGAVQARWSSES